MGAIAFSSARSRPIMLDGELGACEVDRRNGDVHLRGLDDLFDRQAVDEHVVHRALDRVGVEAHGSSSPRLPCGSRSTTSTFMPCSLNATARFRVVVVLATPPFWFAENATTRPMASSLESEECARRDGRGRSGVRRAPSGSPFGSGYQSPFRCQNGSFAPFERLAERPDGRLRPFVPREPRSGPQTSRLGEERTYFLQEDTCRRLVPLETFDLFEPLEDVLRRPYRRGCDGCAALAA